jgi:hypothetical protein
LLVLAPQRDARAADANIAIGSEANASSVENAGTPASAAVDGDPSTRWSSAWSDPQWLQLDLGAEADISGFTINWEAAFATAYHIEVSNDATTWTQVYDTTSGSGGTTNITVPAGTSGRYVRLTGTARTTIGGAQYGYSIYELQVLGRFTQTAVSTASDAASLQQGTSVDIPVNLNLPSTPPPTAAQWRVPTTPPRREPSPLHPASRPSRFTSRHCRLRCTSRPGRSTSRSPTRRPRASSSGPGARRR